MTKYHCQGLVHPQDMSGDITCFFVFEYFKILYGVSVLPTCIYVHHVSIKDARSGHVVARNQIRVLYKSTECS